MASVIKVDQIQSDTGTTQISSNVVSNKTVTGTTDGTIQNVYRGTQGGLYARSVTSNVSAGATESNAAAHIGKADTTGDISVFIGADQGTGSVVSAPCGYIGAISAGLYYAPLVLQPSGSGSVVIQSGQLKFPASQNASTDPNTLDDYEEGSWTPVVTTSSVSTTYTNQSGFYIKIGKFVFFGFQINIGTLSSNGTGTFNIGGLPYTMSATNYGRYFVQTSSVNFDGTAHSMALYPDGGTGLNLLYAYDNGGWSVGTASTFVMTNGSIITAVGNYVAAS